MFSSIIKVTITFLGFAPIFLVLYVLNIVREFDSLHFYFSIRHFSDFVYGLLEILHIHFFLILFLLLFVFTYLLLYFAKHNLTVGRIDVKSIKPADFNFLSVLISGVLPVWKLADPSKSDITYLVGYLVIGIAYGLLIRGSYHFNLTMKIFGYSHFEVQTLGEVTYMVLSRKRLINRKDLTTYVNLTDSMLLNVSDHSG